MAYAEKYMNQNGSGLQDGSSPANAWSLATAFSAVGAVAGDRVNFNTNLTSAGITLTNAGTLISNICIRAYDTVIGDLDNTRRVDGYLDTTNFPTITLTGSLVPSSYSTWQNIIFTGAVSNWLIISTASDYVVMKSCKVENTQNNANAHTVILDNFNEFIDCDFICSGANHGTVLQADGGTQLLMSTVRGVDTDATLVSFANGIIIGNWFIGGSSATAIFVEQATETWLIMNNTGYGVNRLIEIANVAALRYINCINNHMTDSSAYLYSLYTATADQPVVEINNRLRDITTLRTGISDETLRVGEVSTDTGGPETDYVDASNGDLRLISIAPGKDKGLGVGNP